MSGGSSAPKQKISETEKTQARFAVNKHNERIQDGFADLELRMVQDAVNRDYEGFLGGRSSADVAKAETQAYEAKTATPGAMSLRDFRSTGDSVAAGLRQSQVDAATTNETLRDQSRVAMAKLGGDISDTTSGSLAEAARRGGSTAAQKVQNDILKSNARTEAVMTAAKGALSGATLRADGYRLKGGKLTKGTVGKNGEWAANTGDDAHQLSGLRTAGLIFGG